jgi:hypothetical protein
MMGKVIDRGSEPEDSDLFSGGLTWSFHLASKQSTSDGNSDSNNPQTQDKDTPQDEDEILDTIHALRRRLLMLQRNKARPDLIEKLFKQLKDMQDQSEST